MSHVLVMAKAPVAGRVKTRLCPPLTPAEAAEVAAAALSDTLEAVVDCGASHRVLALDGEPGDWLPVGFTVVTQRGRGLDERLTAAWADAWSIAGGPGVQVGMDTPQVTGLMLDDALADLERRATRAVLGPALDGGWWLVGLHRPHPRAFLGVPMSTDGTGAAQVARLTVLGLPPRLLPELRDIDTADDLHAVAEAAPWTRTATTVARLGGALAAIPVGAMS